MLSGVRPVEWSVPRLNCPSGRLSRVRRANKLAEPRAPRASCANRPENWPSLRPKSASRGQAPSNRSVTTSVVWALPFRSRLRRARQASRPAAMAASVEINSSPVPAWAASRAVVLTGSPSTVSSTWPPSPTVRRRHAAQRTPAGKPWFRPGRPRGGYRRNGRPEVSVILPVTSRIRSMMYQIPNPPRLTSFRTPRPMWPR